MNIENIREYCLSLVGTTEDCAFGDDTVLFRLCGKIYACIDLNRPYLFVAKCSPDYAVDLRDKYSGIRGAWHWNKRHWNDVYLNEDVPEELIFSLLDHAYEQIRTSLPKKTLYNFPDIPENWQHFHFPELSSTMDCIAEFPAEENSDKVLLITTDVQTKGRGQKGNSWEAESGKNLLFSFRFSPKDFPAKSQFLLSQITALAATEALSKTLKKGVKIKWPNDIYYEDKKICGILIEHKLSGGILDSTTIGIGINVNQAKFLSDAPNPVSALQILGKEADRAAILRNFIKSFCTYYALLQAGNEALIRERYHKLLYRLDKIALFEDKDGIFKASIKGVDDFGLLLLNDEKGKKRNYSFKEIKYIID